MLKHVCRTPLATQAPFRKETLVHSIRKGFVYFMGILATPPKATPPKNKALLRVYKPLVSLNKALLTPYSWGGVALGGG